jgi:hypothetical protein
MKLAIVWAAIIVTISVILGALVGIAASISAPVHILGNDRFRWAMWGLACIGSPVMIASAVFYPSDWSCMLPASRRVLLKSVLSSVLVVLLLSTVLLASSLSLRTVNGVAEVGGRFVKWHRADSIEIEKALRGRGAFYGSAAGTSALLSLLKILFGAASRARYEQQVTKPTSPVA